MEMQWLKLVEWIGVSVAIIGAYLNARGKKLSFYFWLVANAMIAYVCVREELWGLFTQQIVYAVICTYGILKWKGDAPVRSDDEV